MDNTMDNPSPDSSCPEGDSPSPKPPLDNKIQGAVDLFYNVLFHPQLAFHALDQLDHDIPSQGNRAQENRALGYGLLFVLVVSALSPISLYMGKGGQWQDLALQIPLQGLYGFVMWFVMGSMVALLSYSLTGQTRFKRILTLSAYATLPWILLSPVILIKYGGGTPGAFVGVFLSLVIWVWSVALYAYALMTALKLTLERLLILLVAPFAFLLVSIAWGWGFFINTQRILP